ncbi:hypothetical protein HanPSC8_Chr07g0280381 [Helianthus annuus]|nr:hypothetical protein HanPSC8_Chr17g0772361 [Helianthus annuus]KAJ0904289.1 hypothetical protein HanPSC8_Chr07g0280381 [Helianthus annuus]
MFDMIDGLILVMSRLQAVALRVWDFGGVTDWPKDMGRGPRT